MTPMPLPTEWLDPATTAVLALATLLLLAGTNEKRRALLGPGALLAVLGALALLALLAVPALLPARSAIVHRDGSSEDPRVLSVLVLALAGLAALVPAWRSLRLPALGNVGVALPGIALGGLVGAVALFAGLRQPPGLAGVALGGFVIATSITLSVRARPRDAAAAAMLLAFGAGTLATSGMLSLHGSRAAGVRFSEDQPADTLGVRLSLAGVETSGNRHVLLVGLRAGGDSLRLRPALVGNAGSELASVAAGGLFSGPLAVPLALQELRAHAHDLTWMAQGDSLDVAGARVRFLGFRVVQTDTIRMYADLEVTTASGTQRISPGVIASAHGEEPFAADARGLGPVVAARFDPDHHRVGLVLPQLASGGITHLAIVDLRTRPALPFAWAGAALMLLAFALGWLTGRPSRGEPVRQN